MLYSDEDTGQALAYERLKYDFEGKSILERIDEIYTIRNSDYPQLQNASLLHYLEPWRFVEQQAVKKISATVCMFPSTHPEQKKLKKHIAKLEETPVKNGVRIVRWDEEYGETPGRWVLLEIVEKREWMTEEATTYLKQRKKILETMSYHTAIEQPCSIYFDIDQTNENDDYGFDIFGNDPFTVKTAKNGRKSFLLDAGRFLYFTNGEEIPDDQLIRMQWQQDDRLYFWNVLMNQGETTDLTDEFSEAMFGREFILFLSQIYRDWIYRHMKDTFNEDFDVSQFLEQLQDVCFNVHPDGTVSAENQKDQAFRWLDRFGAKLKDVKQFLEQNLQNDKYLSDEYAN